ncbi:hypothetical protein SRHO_G00121590 [Serrasalmus rhombeus]
MANLMSDYGDLISNHITANTLLRPFRCTTSLTAVVPAEKCSIHKHPILITTTQAFKDPIKATSHRGSEKRLKEKLLEVFKNSRGETRAAMPNGDSITRALGLNLQASLFHAYAVSTIYTGQRVLKAINQPVTWCSLTRCPAGPLLMDHHALSATPRPPCTHSQTVCFSQSSCAA